MAFWIITSKIIIIYNDLVNRLENDYIGKAGFEFFQQILRVFEICRPAFPGELTFIYRKHIAQEKHLSIANRIFRVVNVTILPSVMHALFWGVTKTACGGFLYYSSYGLVRLCLRARVVSVS
jgi:hypothetical protein